MPLATFNPAVRPSPGTTRASKPSLHEAGFADGYSLSAPKGLNHMGIQVSYRWDVLTLEQAMALETFFRARGGYIPFYYALLGESNPRKWLCKEWNMTDSTPAKFTATFVENFSNVT